MHFLVLIALVSLSIPLQNSVPQQHAKATHPDQHSNDTPDNPKPGSQIVYVEATSPNADANGRAKTPASQQASPKWWERPTITDWILALTTLCYVVVNVFVLLAIHRQGNIAAQSVTALMNAEQAILIIDKGEWDFDGKQNIFRWSVANSGKTAATVFAANGSMQIGDGSALPPDVSVYDYHPAHDKIEIVISPNSDKNRMWDTLLKPEPNLTEAQRQDILQGRKYLWSCGFYRYRDIFGRPFTQRYCYRWDWYNGGFSPAGPWEYRRLS